MTGSTILHLVFFPPAIILVVRAIHAICSRPYQYASGYEPRFASMILQVESLINAPWKQLVQILRRWSELESSQQTAVAFILTSLAVFGVIIPFSAWNIYELWQRRAWTRYKNNKQLRRRRMTRSEVERVLSNVQEIE